VQKKNTIEVEEFCKMVCTAKIYFNKELIYIHETLREVKVTCIPMTIFGEFQSIGKDSEKFDFVEDMTGNPLFQDYNATTSGKEFLSHVGATLEEWTERKRRYDMTKVPKDIRDFYNALERNSI